MLFLNTNQNTTQRSTVRDKSQTNNKSWRKAKENLGGGARETTAFDWPNEAKMGGESEKIQMSVTARSASFATTVRPTLSYGRMTYRQYSELHELWGWGTQLNRRIRQKLFSGSSNQN